jgi:hypothetical protein
MLAADDDDFSRTPRRFGEEVAYLRELVPS